MSNPFGIGDFASMGQPGNNPGSTLDQTIALMRQAWSSFSLPPNLAPTIDPDEIGRRIADLRSVEQWLVTNLTVLRGTIQALEIQQTTLATLRAFGVAAGGAAPSAGTAAAPASGMGPHAGTTTADTTPADQAPPPDDGASTAGARPSPGTETQAGADASAAAPGPEALNPMIWWEALQKQFSEVASAAIASIPAALAASATAGNGNGNGNGIGNGNGNGNQDATPPARSRKRADAAGKAATARKAASGTSRRPAAGSPRRKTTPD